MELDNAPPSPSDGAKSPGVSKRKAYTPLRTQYCLRETVVPIQPLSLEQHGKSESPSKITRRISSTEDNEDPLQSSSTGNKGTIKPKSQAGGIKRAKKEETGGRKKRVTKETHGKWSKKAQEEVTVPITSVSTITPVSLSEPIFLTPPLDATLKVTDVSSSAVLPTVTQAIQPTPPYTPTHDVAHVNSTEDHKLKIQSQDTPVSSSDSSMENLSLKSENRVSLTSSNVKSPPPNDSKSISLTCFNVDILNNEDDKSASPAVVTIDPNATHSPINNNEPTSSVVECDPTEERPFIELTKKTASIISNNSSPKRPSLLPFRRRSLSATTGASKTTSVSSRGRRKSEGGRSNQVHAHQYCKVVVYFGFLLADKTTSSRCKDLAKVTCHC